jgi:hypothetical protein
VGRSAELAAIEGQRPSGRSEDHEREGRRHGRRPEADQALLDRDEAGFRRCVGEGLELMRIRLA